MRKKAGHCPLSEQAAEEENEISLWEVGPWIHSPSWE